MSDDVSFRDLLQRVRAGDQEAARQLVRDYEPEIRRSVRVRLTDPRLRRVVDSVDICQSVLANFFVRVALGEFQLEQPEQLLNLLVVMARNKILDKTRRQQAKRRDQRRVEAVAQPALDGVVDSGPSPSRIVAGKDLLEAVRRLLSEEERYLADQRAQGREWSDLARERGAAPDALRKKLSRALDRVAQQLGLEELHHG